jgi:hypothetical protein
LNFASPIFTGDNWRLSMSESTPFSRYKRGYIDGYSAKDRNTGLKNDDDYKMGYEEGKEDDQSGSPNRFSE